MAKLLKRLSPYWLWLLLSLPALSMFNDLLGGNARIVHRLLHPSGEWSVRLLILTLAITPLMMLTKGAGWARWLKANRRYFGVAAFGYAAIHTGLYLVDKASLARILGEIGRVDIWSGWLAFLIFIPLAASSMDLLVRRMGPAWKGLQRWTYVAALFTLLHWASLHGWRTWDDAALWFAPLGVLMLYRLWWLHLRARPGRNLAA